MLNIRCTHCDHRFKKDDHAVGKVSFVGCSNIFKIQYDTKTPCAKCHRNLTLVPAGHEILGTEDSNADSSEKTAYAARVPLENTEISPVAGKAPPTVKVKIGTLQEQDSVQAATKVKAFKILTEQKKSKAYSFKAQVHKPKSSPIPFLKIGISLGGLLVLLVAGFLIYTAIRPGNASSRLASMNVEGMASESLEGDEDEEDSTVLANAGGVTEDVVLEEETQSTRDPLAEALKNAPELLNIPKLDSLTSGYGIRLDPFTSKLAFHGGVDFKANVGTKIYAAMDGFVRFSGKKGRYGNLVKLSHPDGYETRYAHLSKLKVKEGQRVKKGDLIALAGSTGRSTGPHLHFELLKNGKKMDPLSARINQKQVVAQIIHGEQHRH